MLIPTLTQLSEPSSEPIGLDEAKAHLRVDGTEDDALIETLIQAARATCENWTGRQLMQAQWRLTLDWWPAAISIPKPPLVSLDAIKYTSFDGTEQTLAASKYKVAASEYGEIRPAYSETWPDTRAEIDAVRVEFTAGYADAGSVPSALKAGMRLLIGHLYDNRHVVTAETISEVPWTVETLWNGYADPRKG